MQDKRAEGLHRELNRLEEARKRRDRAISDINRIIDEKLYTLTIVKEAYRTVSAILDHGEMVTAIMDLMKGVLTYDISGILLWEENGGSELVMEVVQPSSKRLVDNFNSRLSHIAKKEIGIPLDKGRLVFRWKGESGNLVRRSSRKSKAAFCKFIVLRAGKKKLGILGIGRSENSGDFNEADTRLFSLIGNQSAVGLGNALSHERAQELAITDELTKFYTRRHFKECLEEEVKRSKRYGKVFSIVMLDIDDFKMINDKYGHIQGDKVLIDISKSIRNALREVDLICRYGGEEFIIVMPETGRDGAIKAAERIRRIAKNKRFLISGKSARLTLSLGVASYPFDGVSGEDLIRKADQSLYKAKAGGKDRTC